MDGGISGTGGSLRRRLLAALAALVAVVPIIAGVLIFKEVVRLFGLTTIEVSEHDILRGAALGLI